MPEAKTHRLVSEPQVSARYLADFMDASEQQRRTIIRGCKFRPLVRLIQHRKAKNIIGTYLRSEKGHPADLIVEAEKLREAMANDDFDREVLDNNADYVARFAEVVADLQLPTADIAAPGTCPALMINGVSVTVDICFRLSRITRTNKVRIGAASLRYGKNKPLPTEVGSWQSAFLMAYLKQDAAGVNAEPEAKLCLTIDAHLGVAIPGPTDAIRRFQNMEAACATIAERWPNVPPPKGAVL